MFFTFETLYDVYWVGKKGYTHYRIRSASLGGGENTGNEGGELLLSREERRFLSNLVRERGGEQVTSISGSKALAAGIIEPSWE